MNHLLWAVEDSDNIVCQHCFHSLLYNTVPRQQQVFLLFEGLFSHADEIGQVHEHMCVLPLHQCLEEGILTIQLREELALSTSTV